ncbi:SDR family NAD(P)-dependent oxidoreductase [Caulobacter sp. Root343]|uniref:SDR family NAD(P)-dependent oxidoreductase n=1 Tax=Caulobacter sp. Root343 TaxID=1736520 RepID=UPI0006F3E9F7|nr:SDR family NAD(P)-dependent oxidoreductase [Caulobacter sp. Root343]KQV64119.1 short-chain dehydrogenase [Caulobacter sp. Root343]
MTHGSRFKGKRIIVTGGGSGIGQAVVLRLAAEGGVVLAVDVNGAGLDETLRLAQAAAGHGGRALALSASVADEAAVKAMVANFVAAEGGLDTLVNMAGILRSSHTTETSLEAFNEILAINLGSTFLCCREALPHLEASGGSIVNAASTSAFFGHPYMSAYSASKGAIAALTYALSWEYAKRGVRVNAVAPGGIGTAMTASAAANFPEGVDMSLFMHLARGDYQFGQPEQVAGVVAMLASADGAFMSGEIVRIDGGVHA